MSLDRDPVIPTPDQSAVAIVLKSKPVGVFVKRNAHRLAAERKEPEELETKPVRRLFPTVRNGLASHRLESHERSGDVPQQTGFLYFRHSRFIAAGQDGIQL